MLKYLLFTTIIILVILFFTLFFSTLELKKFKISTYNIYNSKIPKEFNNYKVILISDIHNYLYNANNILETIKIEKPNCVVIAGDMIVYDKGSTNIFNSNFEALDFVKEIASYSDVFFAPGNHEMGYMVKQRDKWLKYEKYILDSESDNIYFLDNKYIDLTRGNSKIRIYGLHLTDGYYKRFVKKQLLVQNIDTLIEPSKQDIFNILIAHNPDYFEQYAMWGADLVLSGHNHGGLVILPVIGGVISPRLRLFPKYDYGIFNHNNSNLILSSGIGAHSLKIRLNNKPELVIINLSNKNN